VSRTTLPLAALLSIVPYFHNRGAVRVADAACDLGLTEPRLRAALWELWSCGLPGYGPGELIDLGFSTEDLDEADLVEVTFTAGIDRPVRLTASEAITLETALAVLVDQPGAVDQVALRELMATLREAAGPGAGAAARPGPGADPGAGPAGEAASGGEAETVRRAVREGRALRFVYHSASSDTSTTRVVDPARVYVSEGRTYVVGVDRSSGGWRTFRTDRMGGVEDVGPRREPGPEPADVTPGWERVERARLHAGGAWLLDEFPFRDVVRNPDGGAEVGVAFHDRAWLLRFLLGHADVLEPLDAGVRAELAERARAGLAAYEFG